jgi:putative phosphoribosyl transferase
MTDERKRGKEQRQSGMPGDGTGQKDVAGPSRLYPGSGPSPKGNTGFGRQREWEEPERSAAGYEDHGDSELTYTRGQIFGGYAAEDRKKQILNLRIRTDNVMLEGELNLPADLRGAVLFAHGSGSSRHSPRNQYVAQVLQDASMATLLFDLLTAAEETVDREAAQLRFDIELLARRVRGATESISQMPEIRDVKIGYFGASTGAAAALVAAAEMSDVVSAIVSRGGRPDLAESALDRVKVPTLCIVGSEDHTVCELNRRAIDRLRCEKRLEIVPRATHLFEEPGALEEVARLAREWFESHLGGRKKQSQAA